MRRNNIVLRTAISLLIAFILALGIGIGASAEDWSVGQKPINSPFGVESTVQVVLGEENTLKVGENSKAIQTVGENPGNDTEVGDVVEETQGVGEENTDSEVGGEDSHSGEENSTEMGSGSESGGDLPQNDGENITQGGDYEINLFEEIYAAIETNADKIFSVLAFIGTLIVGVGYKSGLLPLLRDALSKLKGAIDGVKADGESTKEMTDGRLREIISSVENIEKELSDMKWQYESYEEICRDRDALRLILHGQIDMLYSIFMTSALPQYQKDEVGERISEMREVLKNYEYSEEN